MAFSETPVMLTPAEVALRLRVSAPTVYRWIDTGVLPGAVKVGRAVRIDPERFSEWLAQREVRSSSADPGASVPGSEQVAA